MEEEKKEVKKQDAKATEKEEKKDVKKQDAKATEKVEKKATKPAEKKEEKKVTDKKTTSKQEAPKETKKKFEKASEEKKKSNKGMIIVVAIVVVVVAILACVFLMADSPKKSVETLLGDLKSGNYNQTVLSDLSEEDFDEEARTLLFEKLEWKVQNVTEEGDTATVEVEITNKDFKTIIANYMQKVIKLAFSGENISEDEMTNYLLEELKNDEIEMVTSNQTIILEKQDGKWEVSEENDFVNILLPGFEEAISAFN